VGTAVDLLAREMSETFHDMRSRLHGLSEDEFFWMPAPVHHDAHHGGEIGALRDLYRVTRSAGGHPDAG